MSRRPGLGPVFDTSWPHERPWTNDELAPIEVFYYFDGPLLFSVAAGPFTLLMMKWDELDGADLYTASLVDESMLAALGECRLSVFGAIAYDMRFMVEMDGMSPTKVWRIGVENIPARKLSTPGVACASGHGEVPDVMPGYPVPDWARRRVRHLTRGSSYDVFAESASVQAAEPIVEGEKVTVYLADDGSAWVRPSPEFNDGRFEDVN
ncbi:hypothetical protein D3C71_451570 [compost metagenome]